MFANSLSCYRFECPNCQSLEKALSSYQQGYYKLEESESNPIVFAIARPEDGRDYFDRVFFIFIIII